MRFTVFGTTPVVPYEYALENVCVYPTKLSGHFTLGQHVIQLYAAQHALLRVNGRCGKKRARLDLDLAPLDGTDNLVPTRSDHVVDLDP